MSPQQGPFFLNVTGQDAPIRLDVWLQTRWPNLSRSFWKAFLTDQVVKVDCKLAKPSTLIKNDARIEFQCSLEAINLKNQGHNALEPVPMDLKIVFEDDDVLVVNKPAGLCVHGAPSIKEATLVQGVLAYTNTLSSTDPDRPGIVHRLDRDTSGLLVIAKTNEAHINLAEQFRNKENLRIYLALLQGHLPQGEEIIIKTYMTRDLSHPQKKRSIKLETIDAKYEIGAVPKNYKKAISKFKGMKYYSEFDISLAHIQLETGRTHQIRVHSEVLKLPVVGDPLYNKKGISKKKVTPDLYKALTDNRRQMLHAMVLGFRHPKTNMWNEFQVEPPDDFRGILELLGKKEELKKKEKL